MVNVDGSLNASSGAPTTYQKFDPKWLRKLIQIYTTVDPGSVPQEDLNNVFNQFGIQPVAFVTLKNQAIRAYNPGFARALAAGTAIEQNSDSTFVQTAVSGVTTAGVNDGTTVYTVTTGKTFYCMNMSLGNANGAAFGFYIKVAGTTVFSTWLNAGASQSYCSYFPLFYATSGQAITVTGSGNGGNQVSLIGWEE